MRISVKAYDDDNPEGEKTRRKKQFRWVFWIRHDIPQAADEARRLAAEKVITAAQGKISQTKEKDEDEDCSSAGHIRMRSEGSERTMILRNCKYNIIIFIATIKGKDFYKITMKMPASRREGPSSAEFRVPFYRWTPAMLDEADVKACLSSLRHFWRSPSTNIPDGLVAGDLPENPAVPTD